MWDSGVLKLLLYIFIGYYPLQLRAGFSAVANMYLRIGQIRIDSDMGIGMSNPTIPFLHSIPTFTSHKQLTNFFFPLLKCNPQKYEPNQPVDRGEAEH